MTITLADDILQRAGLTEREVVIELACRLFDADRLGKSEAAALCGMDRPSFESELATRGLAVYHMTDEDWEIEQRARKAG
jgi:predicted HTH domain antitoxin